MSIKTAMDEIRHELKLLGSPNTSIDIYIHDVIEYDDALKIACLMQPVFGGEIEPNHSNGIQWINIFPTGVTVFYNHKKEA